MKRGLSIEKDNVTITDVTLDDITDAQFFCKFLAHSWELEEALEARFAVHEIVCAWMNVGTVANGLPQLFDVVLKDAFRVGENLGHPLWHGDFVDLEVGVRADDGSTGKVDTLAGQVTAEATLFALETLAEATTWFLTWLSGDTWQLRVDVEGDGELEKLPLLYELTGRRSFTALD